MLQMTSISGPSISSKFALQSSHSQIRHMFLPYLWYLFSGSIWEALILKLKFNFTSLLEFLLNMIFNSIVREIYL